MNNKYLDKMSRVAHAANTIRKSIKEQEQWNKSLRDQITPIWGDKSKEGVVADLQEALTLGRTFVRENQTILHELKKALRHYNKRYDREVNAAVRRSRVHAVAQ